MADIESPPVETRDGPTTVGRKARRRRWMSLLRAALRVLGGSVIVFTLYFILPFSNVKDASAWFLLAILLTVVVALMVWQVRGIIDAADPRMRAVEALAVSVPLLLVSFSTVHFLLGQSNPAAYTEPLTRLDSLYFAVTVFSTVGFGDISAVSQSARIVVIVQMLVNILVLGVGARIILGAVEVAKERAATPVATLGDSERPPSHV
jgi:voltage-gated potassium channel